MKRSNLLQIVLILAGIGLAAHLYIKYRVAPDMRFAELKLSTLEGTPAKLSDYKGKAIFLNFWASWCGDCIKEMPSIEKAQQLLQNDNVVFLLVSDESAEKVKAFQERKPYDFNYLLSAQPFDELGIHAIPTTYLINKNGEVVYTKVGGEDWSMPEMVERIRNLGK